jgi:hypothetical protein
MIMKRYYVLFLFLAGFLLLSGCTASLQNYVLEDAPNKVKTINFMENSTKICEEPTCYCMVCENSTVSDWFGLTTKTASLAGGKCYFKEDCIYDATNETGISKYLHDNENAAIRPFMIGTGTTFSDMTSSNAFCKNGQDLAVKWVWSANGDQYPLPEPDRATCLLEKNVIPVYVLYSGGKAISATRAAQIADKFNGAGPVIITTEINFDESKTAEVAAQAIYMKSVCPNCLIAVAPKMGDVKSLDAVMKVAATSIDLVAVGVDSNYYSFADCDQTRLMFYARNFSQYAMKTYSKPSIWPYIMIEEGKRNNADTCNWEDNSTAMLNSFFFLTDLLPSLKYGVVGVAKYSYTGFSNPLNCSSCSETYMAETQEWTTAKLLPIEPRFSQWYAFCSAYVEVDGKSNRVLNVFPGRSDACQTCNQGVQNLNYYTVFSDSGIKATYMTYTQVSTFQAIPADEDINGWAKPQDVSYPELPVLPYYKCNFCVANESNIPVELAGGQNSEGRVVNYGSTLEQCTAFPQIDFYADQWDVDPLLLRAVINHESGFNPCSASVVAKNKAAYDTYKSQGMYVFPGDFGCWKDHSVVGSGADPSGLCPNIEELPEDLAYCAFGLGQVLEHPYWDWTTKADGTVYTGGYATPEQLEAYCFKDYNPLNATHAACRAAWEFKGKWESAEVIVDKYATQLGVADPSKAELKKWYTAAIAAELYRGGFRTAWIYSQTTGTADAEGEFNEQSIQSYASIMATESKLCKKITLEKNDKGELVKKIVDYGPVTSFLDYLANCEGPCQYSDDFQKVKCRTYGKSILSKYYGLASTCLNNNPSGPACPDSRFEKNIK